LYLFLDVESQAIRVGVPSKDTFSKNKLLRVGLQSVKMNFKKVAQLKDWQSALDRARTDDLRLIRATRYQLRYESSTPMSRSFKTCIYFLTVHHSVIWCLPSWSFISLSNRSFTCLLPSTFCAQQLFLIRDQVTRLFLSHHSLYFAKKSLRVSPSIIFKLMVFFLD
jgi:hypothetical protein